MIYDHNTFNTLYIQHNPIRDILSVVLGLLVLFAEFHLNINAMIQFDVLLWIRMNGAIASLIATTLYIVIVSWGIIISISSITALCRLILAKRHIVITLEGIHPNICIYKHKHFISWSLINSISLEKSRDWQSLGLYWRDSIVINYEEHDVMNAGARVFQSRFSNNCVIFDDHIRGDIAELHNILRQKHRRYKRSNNNG